MDSRELSCAAAWAGGGADSGGGGGGGGGRSWGCRTASATLPSTAGPQSASMAAQPFTPGVATAARGSCGPCPALLPPSRSLMCKRLTWRPGALDGEQEFAPPPDVALCSVGP